MSERFSNWLLAGVVVVLAAVAIALPLRGRFVSAGQDQAKATNTAAAGSFEISSTPGGVEILLNGELRGKTPKAGHRQFRSEPILLADLAPGAYEVIGRRAAGESAIRTVQLAPGENQFIHLMVWRPDTVVRLKDGSKLVGMIVEEGSEYLELATSPRAIRRLARDEIDHISATLVRREGPPVRLETSTSSGEPEYVIDPFPAEK